MCCDEFAIEVEKIKVSILRLRTFKQNNNCLGTLTLGILRQNSNQLGILRLGILIEIKNHLGRLRLGILRRKIEMIRYNWH